MNGALHMHMHAVHTPGTLTPCMYLYLPGELSDGGGSHSGSAAPSPMGQGRNQRDSPSGRSVRLPPRHPSRGGLGGSSGRLSPRLDPLEQAQPEPPPPVLPPPAAADAPAVAA